MSEIGKMIIPNSQIPVNTLYKKTLEEFIHEFEDTSIAELHFNHHQNRRVKNLHRLNAMIKMRNGGSDDGSAISMPALSHVGGPIGAFDNISMAQEYATTNGTTRNLPRKGNSINANGMTAGSRSVNPRSVAGRYKMTLPSGREDLNSSMSLNGKPSHLFKSASVSSMNLGNSATGATTDEKLQRSQLNIDKKIREDFDRI